MQNLKSVYSSLPKERLIYLGKSSLSCSELLTVMIGNGSGDYHVHHIVKEIKNLTHNKWHQLYQMEVKDLCQVSGLGPSKAAKIIAALELSKRIQFPQSKGTRLVNSSMVFHFMKSKFFGLSTETFWMICLNQQSKVIDVIHLFSGGLTSTIVDVRVIFQKLGAK